MSRHAVPRSATRRHEELGTESKPLAEWSDLDAYVLLGEPGAGKSWAFESEAASPGCEYVTARKFVNVEPPTEWRARTLFIDGLDEMRASASGRDGPLDGVIRRLDTLGRPRFRLSCREADWLVTVDQAALKAVAPRGDLDVLHLDALSDGEVLELLTRKVGSSIDAMTFLEEASRRSLDHMLRNPLLLELLVEAVGNDWPRTLTDVFGRACELMASEQNRAISAASGLSVLPVDRTIEEAGLLCAVLLLSGADCFALGPAPADSASFVAVQSLPAALGLANAQSALSSKLFVAEGETRFYRHRSIAEYLAARALSKTLKPAAHGSIPLSRLLALMCGPDGGVVEPLRGLFAWLAALCPAHRPALIDRDPLGCILYGDPRSFDTQCKRLVLEKLRREADRFVWFRQGNWTAHPFGALGTTDLAQDFARLLSSTDRDGAHQSHLECAFDAIANGEPLPSLVRALEHVIPDSTYRDDIRVAALQAWLRQPDADLQVARRWLGDMRAGKIEDTRDELCGHLLDALYPAALSPVEAVSFFHISKTDNYIGWYRHFWSSLFFDKTPPTAIPAVADAMAELPVDREQLHERFDRQRFVGRVVAMALDVAGVDAPAARLARWLGLGMDEYGSAALDGEEAQVIRTWLSDQPDVQKRVVAYEMERVKPDPQNGAYFYWPCTEKLYGARRPRDWYQWLLGCAAESAFEPMVKHCVEEAAMAVTRSDPEFDISIEQVEGWIDDHKERWPTAEQWIRRLGDAEPWWSPWCWSIHDQRGKQHRRQAESAAKRTREREERRAELAPQLGAIAAGTAPPKLMRWLAWIYQDRVSDFRGNSAVQRIKAFLGGDDQEAQGAIEGLARVLDRPDLPTVEDVLRSSIEQKPYYIGPACLLGASLAFERDPEAPLKWNDDLVHRLVALCLTEGAESADWYKKLARQRPHLFAEVLLPFAKQCLRRQPQMPTPGLWPLARDDELGDLARLVVPALLDDFPPRARPAQVRRLNTELLPAAFRRLPGDELSAFISRKLQTQVMDSAQRAAWLLAGLRFAPHRRSRELACLSRASAVRMRRLVSTIAEQTDHASPLPPLPDVVCARFIELIGPGASPNYPSDAYWVGPDHHRREIVRGMISRLAASTKPEAAEEIDRLRAMPTLHDWRMSLDAARFDQTKSMRLAGFEHATAGQVVATIAGMAPANAFDLAALVLQQLDDLELRIRGSEANELDHFWRDPVNGQRSPRVENQCRDRLLSLLRPALQGQEVALNKESAHAGDKRADLRAEASTGERLRVVPVEIKREDHRLLWSAWRDQLERTYSSHPAAEGVGIYLVLWFAHRPKPQQRSASAPSSATELQARLRSLIPEQDRSRLLVRVLDLSLPKPRATHRRPSRARR